MQTNLATVVPAPEQLQELSHELAVACDASGRFTWADARARATLNVHVGGRLGDLCVAGTASKADELARHAVAGRVEDWELSLPISGEVRTVAFSGGPWQDQALLVGYVLPRHYEQAMHEMEAAVADVVQLNRESTRQRHELARYATQLESTNVELSDSNRGILSLHRELEDRAASLAHSAEVKSRLVSSVSHEFRTPLTSILGLTQLLLDGADGELPEEQRKQVRFIRTSAEELMTLVNDLLDVSTIESGTASLRIAPFSLHEFEASLRGSLRPLNDGSGPVALVFDGVAEDLVLETDRSKLAQIVRNLVSNALKFTERGRVQVAIRALDGGRVSFAVADTGIGIPAADVDRIFDEFIQLDNPMQARTKGTGLGLAIVKRLSELLGGDVVVDSTVGEGSTFTVTIPAAHPDAVEMHRVEAAGARPDPTRAAVLVVEDDRRSLFVYERYLSMAGFRVIPARTVQTAREVLGRELPVAVVLDVVLEDETTWAFLADLKRDPRTQHVPVLVVTVSNKGQMARALGADEFWLKPIDQTRLLAKLKGLTAAPPVKVLVVDDDERARYLMRRHLGSHPYHLFEAATGEEAVQLAQHERPHVIFLDFLLEHMTAFDVLDELKSNPNTRGIPVIVVTSHVLDAAARERLSRNTEGVIAKQNLSRELAINRIRDARRRGGAAARS